LVTVFHGLVLLLAKIKRAFEMNGVRGGHMDEIQVLIVRVVIGHTKRIPSIMRPPVHYAGD